jgi:putative tricarboxylic transport membrane protein
MFGQPVVCYDTGSIEMNKRIARSEMIWICIFFLLGIVVIISSSFIKVMVVVEKSTIVNSRFFPRLVGIMMSALAIIMLLKDLLGTAVERTTPEKTSGTPHQFLITIGIAILYILILEPVGFFISSWILLLALCILLGIHSKKILILMPLLTSAGIFILFRIALAVPLPLGLLEFLQ